MPNAWQPCGRSRQASCMRAARLHEYVRALSPSSVYELLDDDVQGCAKAVLLYYGHQMPQRWTSPWPVTYPQEEE